ncbi:MAG: hypothetical protein ACYS7Y_29255, partial [Planctomycetota bacterium]
TFNEGDLLYLGVNGAFTATPPDAPRSLALCGAVVRKHASEGVIMFRWGESLALNTLADVYAPFGGSSDGDTIGWVTANNRYELYNPNTPGPYTKAGFFNGTFRETFDMRLNSDGTNVWASIEQPGGGDLTLQWSNGQFTYDTTPAATVNLTPGTDASPTGYYLYIPHTTNTLTATTTLWPLGEEINRVGYVLVPSATFINDHGGGYINQNFNDHLNNVEGGHSVHMAMKIRQQGADWYSGVGPAGTTNSYFTYNTGNMYWASETGLVSQMHPHAFEAQDTTVNDVNIVVNDPDSTYNHVTNLYTGITKDSTGNTLGTNRYFKLVFWGVANKTGEGDFVLINLPSGTYTSQSGAENDLSSYAYYDFPREFDIESGTAFLICEAVFQKQGTGWDWKSTTDLRGRSPSKIAGGVGGGTNDHGSLGGLADDDHTQYALVDGTRAFTGNVAITANLALTDYINGYGGTLSDGWVLKWVTANARFEAAPSSTTDHGGLTGLGDDDHSQYSLVTGNRAFTGNVHTSHLFTANNIDSPSGANQVLQSTNSGNAAFTQNLLVGSLNASTFIVADLLVNTPNIGGPSGNVSFGTSNILSTADITTTGIISGGLLSVDNIQINDSEITSNASVISINNADVNVELDLNVEGAFTVDGAAVPVFTNTANYTINVTTTGNDTTGDGSSISPYATVARALQDLRKLVPAGDVDQDYLILIHVAAGHYTESAQLKPGYAYGGQVNIDGEVQDCNASTANSYGSDTALSSGLSYIDVSGQLVSGTTATVGDYLVVKAASGGTNPHLTEGSHEITAWNSGNRDVTFRVVRRSGISAVPSGTINLATAYVAKTKITSSASAGIKCGGSTSGGKWNKMVLVGPGTSGSGVWIVNGASISLDAYFSTSGWDQNLYAQNMALIFADQTVHSYSDATCVKLQNGAVINLRYGAVISGVRSIGVNCFLGATLAGYQLRASTAGSASVINCSQGGFVDASSSIIKDPFSTAVYGNATIGGGIDFTGGTQTGGSASTTATNGYIVGP